jgi:hypothetical protein
MNSRLLAWLSAATVLVALLAVWMATTRTPSDTEAVALYPDLKGKMTDVTGVDIYKAGDQLAVQLVRDGNRWQVKQRANYPADTAKVVSLLLAVQDAKIREQKTANPANYSALAVQDVSDTGTTGVRIELAGAPVKLIVGKRDASGKSTYVRRVGETQSLSVDAQLDAPTEPSQWLQHAIVDISADRVREVAVQLGTTRYSVVKEKRADANFDVKPLPKGRELSSVSVGNAFAQTLIGLQLEDVTPVTELQGKSAGQVRFATFDGLTIDVDGYSIDDKRWLVFKAGFDEALARRFYVPTTAPAAAPAADGKPAATPPPSPTDGLDAALKKGSEEAAALNQRLSGWAFAVPSYKYDAVFKPLDQLLLKK